MKHEKYQRTAALLHSTVRGDVVALDVDRGRCFATEEVGARIWQLLAQPTDVPAICEALTREYDVDAETCSTGVRQFVHQAIHGGVVRPV